jgi:hypothetical protein
MFNDMHRMFDSALRVINGVIQILESKIQISVFWLLLVAITGMVFGWLIAKKRITELSNTLAIERARKSDLTRTVEALSNKALRQNNEAFFALANGRIPLAMWRASWMQWGAARPCSLDEARVKGPLLR